MLSATLTGSWPCELDALETPRNFASKGNPRRGRWTASAIETLAEDQEKQREVLNALVGKLQAHRRMHQLRQKVEVLKCEVALATFFPEPEPEPPLIPAF